MKEALKLALEALEMFCEHGAILRPIETRDAIKEALAQPEQERLIRIMGTFDLATGHADTFDELLDSLELELRDVLGHYRAAVKEPLTQEPIAMLERIPRLGILRVTYEDAVTELHEGLYPLYVKPQIEVGCAECGVNGGHALYCVVCAEKFFISEAIQHERNECAGIDVPITIPNRDYSDMSPLEIYEEALMDATLSFRAAIRARGQA